MMSLAHGRMVLVGGTIIVIGRAAAVSLSFEGGIRDAIKSALPFALSDIHLIPILDPLAVLSP